MLINSLEISNFRPFFGKQKVVFSTDVEKNVTLIHAENGVGKTAFLNAIMWCFFARTTDNFKRPTELLNHQARDQGTDSFYVHVEFQDEGITYVVQRGVNSLSGKTFRVFKILENGSHSQVDSPEIFINSIIPKDMARYFFFQGEGVGSLTGGGGADVKDAIRDILGFTVAEIALKDLGKIMSEYRKELSRIDNSSELGKIQRQLDNCEDQLSSLTSNFKECETDEITIVGKIREVEELLRSSNSDVVAEKQKIRDSKQSELGRLKAIREAALTRKASLVGKYAVSAFASNIADEGIDFIDEKELKGKIPEPYNVQLVKDILQQGKCICGSEVISGTAQFGEIQKLLGKAADPDLIRRVTRARSQLTVIRRDLESAEKDISGVLRDIANSEESIARVETDLRTLSIEIKGVDFEGIAELESRRSTLSKQRRETTVRLGSLKSKKDQLEKQKKDLESQENKVQSSEPEVVRLRGYIDFIRSVETELSSVLTSSEQSSLELLAEKINSFLDKYVKQDFNAKISKNFEIVLYDRKNRPVGESDGQSLLLSLTFISSLIDLARIRKNASGEILTPGTVAPFIIDAPFGVLDNTYKANIASQIPNSVNQVVFLLSSSHWEGTVEDVLRKKVGREYNMVLEVASDKSSIEIAKKYILEKTYDTVRYHTEFDMTRIEEVGCYV